MPQITIRGVSEELDQRLKVLARERGESMNSTILSILAAAAGLSERRAALSRYQTWDASDARAFEAALRAQREIDDKLWR